MPRLALITAIDSATCDQDLMPLRLACAATGLQADCLAWDDPTVSWSRYDAVLLRSPWNYTQYHPQFMAWCRRVAENSLLLNPLPVVQWNADKHYLSDLGADGLPVIPTRFIECDDDPLPALQEFLRDEAIEEFVVKPAISAGARDTQRYARSQEFAASNQIARLQLDQRGVLLQPYLARVDAEGETALVYLHGRFSHAIRKGPLLATNGADVGAAGQEDISPRTPSADELDLGRRALEWVEKRFGLDLPLTYARVDMLRDAGASARLLELELVEPSLFLTHAPQAIEPFARDLASRLRDTSAAAVSRN